MKLPDIGGGHLPRPFAPQRRPNVYPEVHVIEVCGAGFAGGTNLFVHELIDEIRNHRRGAAGRPVVWRVLAETDLCQNVARSFARLVGRQYRNRPERDAPFSDAAATAMRAVFDDPTAYAVRRHRSQTPARLRRRRCKPGRGSAARRWLAWSVSVSSRWCSGPAVSRLQKTMAIGGDRRVATGSPPVGEYGKSPGNDGNWEIQLKQGSRNAQRQPRIPGNVRPSIVRIWGSGVRISSGAPVISKT